MADNKIKAVKIISILLIIGLFSLYAYSYYNHSVTEKMIEEEKTNKTIKALLTSLKEGDADAQKSAFLEVGEIGEAAVKPLITALEDEGLHFRKRAVNALINIGEPAVKPLIEALDNDKQTIRRSAAFALDVNDPNWAASEAAIDEIPALIASLGSNNIKHREDAAVMLSKIGAPAVKPIIEKLSDTVWYAREAAVSALGGIDDTRGIDPLIAMLDDDHWQVRRTAVYALGKMGNGYALNPLSISMKNDKSVDVKLAARKSIKRLEMLYEAPKVVEEE